MKWLSEPDKISSALIVISAGILAADVTRVLAEYFVPRIPDFLRVFKARLQAFWDTHRASKVQKPLPANTETPPGSSDNSTNDEDDPFAFPVPRAEELLADVIRNLFRCSAEVDYRKNAVKLTKKLSVSQDVARLSYQIACDETDRLRRQHSGVSCNSCGMSPILGRRFRCINCVDYDLCEMCESAHRHDPFHVLQCIQTPVAIGLSPTWMTPAPTVPVTVDPRFQLPPEEMCLEKATVELNECTNSECRKGETGVLKRRVVQRLPDALNERLISLRPSSPEEIYSLYVQFISVADVPLKQGEFYKSFPGLVPFGISRRQFCIIGGFHVKQRFNLFPNELFSVFDTDQKGALSFEDYFLLCKQPFVNASQVLRDIFKPRGYSSEQLQKLYYGICVYLKIKSYLGRTFVPSYGVNGIISSGRERPLAIAFSEWLDPGDPEIDMDLAEDAPITDGRGLAAELMAQQEVLGAEQLELKDWLLNTNTAAYSFVDKSVAEFAP